MISTLTAAKTQVALKSQLLAAVDDAFVNEVSDRLWGYGQVTVLELLTHLCETYGLITSNQLDENAATLDREWNPDDPLERLWQRVRESLLLLHHPFNLTDINLQLSNFLVSDRKLTRFLASLPMIPAPPAAEKPVAIVVPVPVAAAPVAAVVPPPLTVVTPTPTNLNENDEPACNGSGFGMTKGTANTYIIDGMDEMTADEYQAALALEVVERARGKHQYGLKGVLLEIVKVSII